MQSALSDNYFVLNELMRGKNYLSIVFAFLAFFISANLFAANYGFSGSNLEDPFQVLLDEYRLIEDKDELIQWCIDNEIDDKIDFRLSLEGMIEQIDEYYFG